MIVIASMTEQNSQLYFLLRAFAFNLTHLRVKWILASSCSSEHKISSGDDAEQNYNSECISGLRRKLEEKGLDVDGSREMLVKRLKTNSRMFYV